MSHDCKDDRRQPLSTNSPRQVEPILQFFSSFQPISARDVLKICGQKWRCVFHAPQRPSRWELGPCQQVCRCSLTTISQSHHAPVWSDGLLARQRSLLRDGDGKHFPQRCSARFPQVTWESDPNHSTYFDILHFHQVGDCTLGRAIAQWLHLWKYRRQRRKSHGNATPEGCRNTWNGSCLAGDQLRLRSLVLIFLFAYEFYVIAFALGQYIAVRSRKPTGFRRCGLET